METYLRRVVPVRRGKRASVDAMARFSAPGRAAFELSVALCALSLVFPWIAVVALAASLRALSQGSRSAWFVLPCSVWCCLLSLAIRQYLGFGVFP